MTNEPRSPDVVPGRFAMEVLAHSFAEITVRALDAAGAVRLDWFLDRFRFHLIENLRERGARQNYIASLFGITDRSLRSYRESSPGPPWHQPSLAVLAALELAGPLGMDRRELEIALADRLEGVSVTPGFVDDIVTRLAHAGLVHPVDGGAWALCSTSPARDRVLADLCRMRIYQRPGISGTALARELDVDFDRELLPILRTLREEGAIRTDGRGFACLDVDDYVLDGRDPRQRALVIAEQLVYLAGTIHARMRRLESGDAPPTGLDVPPGFSTFTIDVSDQRLHEPAFHTLRTYVRESVDRARALKRELPPLSLTPNDVGRARRRIVMLFAQFLNEYEGPPPDPDDA